MRKGERREEEADAHKLLCRCITACEGRSNEGLISIADQCFTDVQPRERPLSLHLSVRRSTMFKKALSCVSPLKLLRSEPNDRTQSSDVTQIRFNEF
eukprot:751195-Hanusia_phi.AAC.1